MSSVTRRRFERPVCLGIVTLCVALALVITPLGAASARAGGVIEAWEAARGAGSYRFSASIQQTVTSRPTVLTVGRETKQDRFHLEGEADLADQRLHLTLWSQGGSLLDPGTGVEIRIEGDRAYGRQGSQDWEEIPNFAGAFAPSGDFMAFLAAARDIVDRGPQTRAGLAYNLYTFQIDGPSYAAYMRDQMQESLMGKDGLPSGVRLAIPQEYAGLTGDGELWVGADDLPMRQVLHLQFAPDERGSQTAAEVTVDFSAFGSIEPAASRMGQTLRPQAGGTPPAFMGLLGRSLVALLCLGFAACLILFRRSRRFYWIVVIVVIGSMVVVPLLQSDRVYAFSRSQEARAASQRALQDRAEASRAAQLAMAAGDRNPNADPLAVWKGSLLAGQQRAASQSRLPQAGLLAGSGEGGADQVDCDMDDPADDDGDGLPNGAECALGTDPESDDTDGDGIGDNVEVTGFTYNGQTWYGDPLEMDSNRDGLGDIREWNLDQDGDGLPDDTDGDGTPDLFDRDNDGDGVPDKIDLSPYYAGTVAYTNAAPFELVLDELNEGRPAFVEFQLRPTDPDHLWYAFNVLDWPDGDRQGQIQDADGKTFYDLDSTLPRSPNDNGDVKLVPMLEIRISGQPDNLPPAEQCVRDGQTHACYPDLEPYGITVQDVNDAGDKAAYVPLRLVKDQTGGEHVAFQGKMAYRAAATWGNAHQVRLVWVVQALVDVCAKYWDGQCARYERYNDLQVLHTYYDDAWTLTGLNVREDHGTDTATVFEDPSIDNDLDKEEPLVRLMYGLNHTFLAGSDCEVWDDNGTPDDYDDDRCLQGNNARDLTVAEIERRWNWSTNDSVPLSPERWSIEPDILVVERASFGTQDQAIANLVMTTTRQILDDHFTAHWSPAEPISPTILFAREDSFRSLGLDAHLDGDAALVGWSEGDRRLTLDLAPDAVELLVLAELNWAPYRYDEEAGAWESYPIDEYWELLGERADVEFADETDPELLEGKRGIAQLLYLTVYQGMSNVVEINGEVVPKSYQTYDKPLGATIAGLGAKVLVLIVNQLFLKAFWNADRVTRAVFQLLKTQRFAKSGLTAAGGLWGQWIKPAVRDFYKMVRFMMNGLDDNFSALRAAAGLYLCVLLIGLVVAVSLLVPRYLEGNPAARIALAILVAVVMTALTVVMPLLLVADAIMAFKAIHGLSTAAAAFRALSSGSELIGTAAKAGAVGLFVTLSITWGIFLYVWLSGQVKAGTIAFDLALAQSVAFTIFALLLFIISVSVVGLILTAIYGVVDLFITLLGLDWTLTGALVQLIADILVCYEVAVDVDVDMGNLDMSLVHPLEGFVDGAELQFSAVVTTTVTHKVPEESRNRQAAYNGMYNEAQLRRSEINYRLAVPFDTSSPWSTGNEWLDVHKAFHAAGSDMLTGWKAEDVSAEGVFLRSGINGKYPLPLDLRVRFSLPAVECWYVFFWPVCLDKEIEGSTTAGLGSVLRFDVLPATLAEFVDVSGWADGLLLRDADGDGLLAPYYGGDDPDDTRWDTDGDGLSDSWEMAMSALPAGEGGYRYDPTRPDTDLDGLADGDEARHGTDPANADSDGDTLSDVAEVVDGWQFTFWQGRSIRVYSDPLDADTDKDGMDDAFERALHTCPGCDPLANRYHPRVWNSNPIGLGTQLGLDMAVIAPGQTFAYTTTVQNNLNPDLWIRGATALDAGPFTGGPAGMSFDLPRAASQALVSQLGAPPGAGTQDVDLHTDLDAQLHTASVWAWDDEQRGSGATATGARVDAVAVSPVAGWTVPYVVASLENNLIYAYAATANDVVGSGVHAIGWQTNISNAPPDVACNDAGTCLVVWSSYWVEGDDHYFRWRKLLPTLQVSGDVWTITAPEGQETYGGRIASNGDGFLVVWQMGTDAGQTLYAQAVNAEGDTSGSRLTLDTGLVDGADVTWAFDHYLVVWSRDGDLYAASIPAGTVSESWTVSAMPAQEADVRVAYDPAGQRSLAIYRSVEDGEATLRGRILARREVGAELSLADLGNPASPLSLSVSPDPMNGGWAVAYLEKMSQARATQAVAMDGSLRGDPQLPDVSLNSLTGQDLACAEPRPDTRLLFDEGAGATNFADSSGFGRNGTCAGSACPTSGADGREGNAVTFDGIDDYVMVTVDPSDTQYGVTLWFKTTCQSCGLYQLANDAPVDGHNKDRNLYLNRGNVCARVYKEETICTSGPNVADGNWHFLAHTLGGSVGGQKLYVDGVLRASGNKAISNFDWHNRVIIGYSYQAPTRFLAGSIDEVTVYSRSLSEGEVRDRYRSALAIYALDEAAGSTNFQNAAHNGYSASCSGSTCPTAGEPGMAYAAARFDGVDDRLIVADQPRTVYEVFYDFETDAGSGWNNTTRSTAPAGQTFLGRFGNQEVTLDFSNLPVHDQVEISYDLYVIRTWQGNSTLGGYGPDTWEWWAGGNRQLRTTFSNFDPPYEWQAYPGEPFTPSGLTLYQNSDCTGQSLSMSADNPDYDVYWRPKCYQLGSDTAAVIYWNYHYGGGTRSMDGPWCAEYGSECPIQAEFGSGSARVWAAGNNWRDHATAIGSLGYEPDSVYHIVKPIDHQGDTLQFKFKGSGLEALDNESWGLDNVRVRVLSRNVPLANSSFTVALWARREAIDRWDMAMGQGTGEPNVGLHLGFRSSNVFTCGFWGNDLNSPAYTDTDWHHWACTYDAASNRRTLYRDGAEVAQDTAPADYQGSGTLWLGQAPWESARFRGLLDEVAVWNQALSASEIERLFEKVKVVDDSLTECVRPLGMEGAASILMGGLGLRETTTTLGTSQRQAEDTITIDATLPNSIITSLGDGQYLAVTRTLAIGGEAGDNTHVGSVAVSVDGGPWHDATGTEAWSFGWDTSGLDEGAHTLRSRATDVVGNEEAPQSITVVLDRTPPQATLDTPPQRAVPGLDADWEVELTGTVADPDAGSLPGSGVHSLEVLLQGATGVAGAGWQTATVQTDGTWSIRYGLPEFDNDDQVIPQPTGVYTVSLRPVDAVRNWSIDLVPWPLVELDNTPPLARLRDPDPDTKALTVTNMTLSGVITDVGAAASGIQGAEIALRPAEQMGIYDGAVVFLRGDDPPAAEYEPARAFEDSSGFSNHGRCERYHCPDAQPDQGRIDGALYFDGYHSDPDSLSIEQSDSLNLGAGEGHFALAAWIWSTHGAWSNSTFGLLGHPYDEGGRAPWLELFHPTSSSDYYAVRAGFTDAGGTAWTVQTGADARLRSWKHVVATFDGDYLRIYLNGQQAAQVATPPGTRPVDRAVPYNVGDPFAEDYAFAGDLDEVLIYHRALSPLEVQALYDAASLAWQPLTLAESGVGVLTTTWSYAVPGDMEGYYDIAVRGADVAGNRNNRSQEHGVWTGEIDTLAPRNNPHWNGWGSWWEFQTRFYCNVTDMNLVESTLTGCRCPEADWQRTYYHEVSEWYQDTVSDTGRLYNITAECLLNAPWPGCYANTVCDRHGHCTTTQDCHTQLQEAPQANLIYSAILTPTNGSVTGTVPVGVGVEGAAHADGYLKSLTVTANGSPFYTQSWPSASPGSTQDADWSTVYDPLGEGQVILEASATDWAGGVQTTTHPITITVDLLAPTAPVLDTQVFTKAHLVQSGTVALTGIAADTVGVARVDVNPGNIGWRDASLYGDPTNPTWRSLWFLGSAKPDGEVIDVVARATDFAGHATQATVPVLVDLKPPDSVTVTLGYIDLQGAQHVIEPGDTVRDGSLLTLAWTPSSDGNGVAGYWVGYTQSPTDTTGMVFVPHGTVYSVTLPVAEAQVVYARVVPIDLAGNRQNQATGPVYVDAPLTPDILSLATPAFAGGLYRGWMGSGCSELGLSRRIPDHAPYNASLSEAQQLYGTWNDEGLRLAWTGANWNSEGDLFVYLDTRPGGATQLYDPYGSDTTIYLPGNVPLVDTGDWPVFEAMRHTQAISPMLTLAMQADYLVWVEDASIATLYAWDGIGWVPGTQLSDAEYRLTYDRVSTSGQGAVGAPTHITDLYLPFELLDIANPLTAQVTLLAAASDEEALHLWSVLPELNLVDSARVVNPLAAVVEGQEYLLTTAYRWLSLGPGLCPYLLAWPQPLEEAGFIDCDLRAELSAQPMGTSYALIGDDLAWQWWRIFLEPGPKSQGFTFMDNSHRPLGHGQVVTYTLSVSNHGEAAASDVQALVSAYYALLLPGGTPDPSGYRDVQVVSLGEIPPGETATATFTGVAEVEANARYDRCLYVDGLPPAVCRQLLEWAAVDALLFDSRLPLSITQGIPLGLPVEWLWADHAIDLDPPAYLGITEPGASVRPATTTIGGYATDPSGVPLVEVEIRDGGGGSTFLACPDAQPDDGRWSCPWTVSGTDGDTYELRARATDGLGHTSDWSVPWHTTIVDTAPPTVTLSAGAQAAVSGQVVGPEGVLLAGDVADEHGSASVQVCRGGAGGELCEQATMLIATQAPTATALVYDDVPPSPIPLDGAATCGGAEIIRTFTVPDQFVVGDVDLGLNASHPAREEVVAELISPAGTRARVIYTNGTVYGYEHYDVWLDDAASQPLHVPLDDDPAEPYYDRPARPEAPLSVFAGELAAGEWQLWICDLNPLLNDGAYRRARLGLTPRGAAVSTAGRWTYHLQPAEGADGLAQTATIHATDEAGNRGGAAVTLSFIGDVVAPALAVTAQRSQIYELALQAVLSGTVSDGESVTAVWVRVVPPQGAEYREGTTLTGSTWRYTPQPMAPGSYVLWVHARDRAGNERAMGPYQLEILPGPYPCHARVESSGQVYGSVDATAVQQAVDAAVAGDTVKIAGTCAGTGVRAGLAQTLYLNRTLSLLGGYTEDDWLASEPAANLTTLDAASLGRVLYASGPITLTLQGLTLRGGDATNLGGGLGGYDAGGGIYAISATLAISDCVVEDNLASGSGPGQGGGIYLAGGRGSLLGNTVGDNVASLAGRGWGGGLYLSGGDLYLAGNVMEGNVASASAGGWGGGLYAFASQTEMVNNLLQFNVATQGPGTGYGGAVSAVNGGLAFRGGWVRRNTASSAGDGYGGGLHMLSARGTLSGTRVISNTAALHEAATGRGGGLLLSGSWPLALTNNILSSNQANSEGSELCLINDTPVGGDRVILRHNTLAGGGQGVYVGSQVTATLTNTIVAGYYTGLYAESGSLVELEATLWHGNGLDSAGPGTVISHSNVYGDPVFVDPAGDDYHLAEGSAAVDQGVDVGVACDIDGESRPVGLGHDIGADELQSSIGPSFRLYLPVVMVSSADEPNPSFRLYLPAVMRNQ